MSDMKALQKWIEVTGHFDHDTDCEFVFDCELPEDGQEILVTLIGGAICRDICHIDKMGYQLESGCDWDDVFKWAPMPPAWWEENAHSRKGVFIPDITVEMFRNASLEGVEDFMTSGEMEDISLPSAQPEQRYTEEELRVFKHGISLSLLSKRSSQHWQYDEDTATEIKFLERLYEKVSADMRGAE